MKRRWKILLSFTTACALFYSARLIYFAGFKTWHPLPNSVPIHSGNKNPSDCKGMILTRKAFAGYGKVFSVDNIYADSFRVDKWQKRARIIVLDKPDIHVLDENVSADLGVGESFTHEQIGTVTLLNVDIDWFHFGLIGHSKDSTATICLEPAQDFNDENRRKEDEYEMQRKY